MVKTNVDNCSEYTPWSTLCQVLLALPPRRVLRVELIETLNLINTTQPIAIAVVLPCCIRELVQPRCRTFTILRINLKVTLTLGDTECGTVSNIFREQAYLLLHGKLFALHSTVHVWE